MTLIGCGITTENENITTVFRKPTGMEIILDILIKIKENEKKLNDGSSRKDAAIKVKFHGEDKYQIEHNVNGVFSKLSDLIGHNWSIYTCDEDCELEHDYSDDELNMYTIIIVPSFYISKRSRDTLSEFVTKVFPATNKTTQAAEMVEKLLGACDEDSRARVDLTLGNVVEWLDDRDWGALYISEEMYKTLDHEYLKKVI
jgi:hypothetical protein